MLNNVATVSLYDSTCKIRRKKLTSLLMAFWSVAASCCSSVFLYRNRLTYVHSLTLNTKSHRYKFNNNITKTQSNLYNTKARQHQFNCSTNDTRAKHSSLLWAYVRKGQPTYQIQTHQNIGITSFRLPEHNGGTDR